MIVPDVTEENTATQHDVGDATDPIKQHPYWLNQIKFQSVRKQIQYNMDHDIIEINSRECRPSYIF